MFKCVTTFNNNDKCFTFKGTILPIACSCKNVNVPHQQSGTVCYFFCILVLIFEDLTIKVLPHLASLSEEDKSRAGERRKWTLVVTVYEEFCSDGSNKSQACSHTGVVPHAVPASC